VRATDLLYVSRRPALRNLDYWRADAFLRVKARKIPRSAVAKVAASLKEFGC
jgi:hypothetical protein